MSATINRVFDVLALGDRFSAAYSSIDDVIRSFGKITYRSEHSFGGADEAIDFVRNSSFEFIVMPNPYGNQRRFHIYNKLRSFGFPVLVFDRGGLPDSWFFDVGFNADSPSYSALEWDQPLSDAERTDVRAYIAGIVGSDRALEAQGSRVGAQRLREELSIGDRKVLFVPFQRPSDTTMKFFADSAKDFEFFTQMIEETTSILRIHAPEWVVLAKKHPLELEAPSSSIRFVDDGTHVHDLLELCDAVALVNSGVGLLASLFNKPVYYFGKSYYAHPGINRHVQSATALFLNAVRNPVQFDAEVRDRLIHHLTKRVYSFGKFETELVRQKEGHLINVTRQIDFYDLKLPFSRLFRKKKFYL